MTKRWICGALLLAFGLSMVACGSDSSGNGEPTPVTGTVEASGTRAPLEEPTIEGASVTFPAKGYRIEVPADWEFEANAVRSEEITPDFLIHPDEIDGVQASVVLSCEVLRGEATEITLEQFFDNKAARAQQVGATDIVEGAEVLVDGVEARLLEYKRVVGGISIVRRDLLFVSEGCAWQIAYTSAPSTRERFQPDVDAFVASFSFVGN